jgi:undecaprenyl-diphosphatase
VQLVSFFHSLWGHAWLDSIMIEIANFGLFVSLAAFMYGLWRRRPHGLLPWFALGTVAAVGLDLLGGRVFFDPRPFVRLNVAPLFAHSMDNGFPSDHSAVAAFLAGILWFVDAPAAAVATVAAVAIGVARMYALVHWPVDVIAGWVIGAVPAVVVMRFWRVRNETTSTKP